MGREIVTTTNSTELPLIMADFETYNLGDFQLKSGGSIPNTYIAYKTYGDPKSPAIIYPTWNSGSV